MHPSKIILGGKRGLLSGAVKFWVLFFLNAFCIQRAFVVEHVLIKELISLFLVPLAVLNEISCHLRIFLQMTILFFK